jgi:hypothetical protein
MLEIVKSNGETSNNSIRLVVAILAISIARLVATTLAVPVTAAPLTASGASWFNCIKGVLGELVNLIIKKF